MKLSLTPTQKSSVAKLIELALQLDCGMYGCLPKYWQNPGVAGLCAFRLYSGCFVGREKSINSSKEDLYGYIWGKTFDSCYYTE